MIDQRIHGEEPVSYAHRKKCTGRKSKRPYAICCYYNWAFNSGWDICRRYSTRKARDHALRILSKKLHWGFRLFEYEAAEIVFPDEYQLGIISSD